MPTCLERQQNTGEVRPAMFKSQIKCQILLSPQAIDTRVSFNSPLRRGKNQSVRKLTGLFSHKGESHNCQISVSDTADTPKYVIQRHLPDLVPLTPLQMPEHPLPATSQPPQSRTVLWRSADPNEGLAQPQFIPQRQRTTQNSERCATDRQGVLILSPPSSPATDSRRPCGLHEGRAADSGGHGGTSLWQEPGVHNFEGPD